MEQMQRVIDLETSSGRRMKNVAYCEINLYMDMIAEGKEDFIILNSQDGFLQFYGVDDQFVAEMRVNYANKDFRTVSFINPEKKSALRRIVLETPYGRYTPMERDVISYARLKEIVKNYYKYPVCEAFLKETDWADTTEETKRCMGIL